MNRLEESVLRISKEYIDTVLLRKGFFKLHYNEEGEGEMVIKFKRHSNSRPLGALAIYGSDVEISGQNPDFVEYMKRKLK